MVARAMNEVLSQGVALEILAMCINVFVSRAMDGARFSNGHPRLHHAKRGFLCTENNIVDFSLACRELASYRICACNIGGIFVELRSDIYHDDFALVHLP